MTVPRAATGPGRQLRPLLAGLGVGLVLADSSVVTLGLPDVLRRFDVSVTVVARVLIAFNLALALAAPVAALAARRAPRATAAAGLLVFAGASAACAAAPSYDALVGARVVQALGGAGAVVGVLAIVARDPRGLERWTFAGIAGAAVGPAAGGALTQLAGWQAIFWAQVPLAVVALGVLRGPVAAGPAPRAAPVSRRGRYLLVLASQVLVSAALSAALFLLVLLLVDGWRFAPLAAAAVISAMPLAAFAAPTLRVSREAAAAAGTILIGGGLGALALLPAASAVATLPPQLAIGLGLGLSLEALTRAGLASGAPVMRGAQAIAARHAGVVLGLALLAPALAVDLDRAQDDALQGGTALVLDARIPPGSKITVARDVLRAVDRSHGQVPSIEPAFRDRTGPQYRVLRDALRDDLDRAATHAFSRSFALAALFALAGLVPLLFARRELRS